MGAVIDVHFQKLHDEMSALDRMVKKMMKSAMRTDPSDTIERPNFDRYVADLIIKESIEKQNQPHKYDLLPEERPITTKTNTRFLSSIVKTTDSHNKRLLESAEKSSRRLLKELEYDELKYHSKSSERKRCSRSRERKHYSRSRERKHYSRSRERKHYSRSRERKHYSRSRERKHYSRSSERDPHARSRERKSHSRSQERRSYTRGRERKSHSRSSERKYSKYHYSRDRNDRQDYIEKRRLSDESYQRKERKDEKSILKEKPYKPSISKSYSEGSAKSETKKRSKSYRPTPLNKPSPKKRKGRGSFHEVKTFGINDGSIKKMHPSRLDAFFDNEKYDPLLDMGNYDDSNLDLYVDRLMVMEESVKSKRKIVDSFVLPVSKFASL